MILSGKAIVDRATKTHGPKVVSTTKRPDRVAILRQVFESIDATF